VTTLGAQFATALAAKDFDRVRALLHPEIDFRGMTPSRFWEAGDRDALIADVLQQWFEPSDEIESVEAIQTGVIADRERVGYRFSVRNPDGHFTVEQQAYLGAVDGQIAWLRVMCSGFRPALPPR
jgi:hypothetical protein